MGSALTYFNLLDPDDPRSQVTNITQGRDRTESIAKVFDPPGDLSQIQRMDQFYIAPR